ncbi:hypothetical protein NECAME_15852 [Necator americanus]|uniref:Uncharacterized protein n=1 Tax=Necator americanus TaxID=51031 RepID=W2SFN1_NECAM|nr:hypothetical protein NECAME_15852 [Necator americanus]ETN68390.1 hypothetical protein NECAME_15852 [Necator americanus]
MAVQQQRMYVSNTSDDRLKKMDDEVQMKPTALRRIDARIDSIYDVTESWERRWYAENLLNSLGHLKC